MQRELYQQINLDNYLDLAALEENKFEDFLNICCKQSPNQFLSPKNSNKSDQETGNW